MNQSTQQPVSVQSETEVTIDQAKLNALLEQMRMEQNFPLAVIAGLLTSIAGALIWAAVTAATGYQIGWMAVGVGILVGYSVRTLGKGMTSTYGVVGAVMSLFGCLLGNLLSICIFVAKARNVPVMDVVGSLSLGGIVDLMAAAFHPMDLLFYAIAVYEGYRFSFRTLGDDDLQNVLTQNAAQ